MLVDMALANAREEELRAALKSLVPDFINGATPNNGVPSITEPTKRRRPSGEMQRVGF
jgi:hypothetical protein